jgi:hypothetical protein
MRKYTKKNTTKISVENTVSNIAAGRFMSLELHVSIESDEGD